MQRINSLKNIIISTFIFWGILSFLPRSVEAKVIDRVLATVNDELITQSELDRFMKPIVEQYRAAYGDSEEFSGKLEETRYRVLQQLIDDRLVLSKAKEMGIIVEEWEAGEELTKLKQQFPNEESFSDALAKQGLTLKELKETLRQQIMKKKVVEIEVRNKIVIKPAEINEYYQAHIDDFNKREEAHFRMILIKRDSDNQDARLAAKRAYNLASLLLKHIKEGKDFSDIAKRYSMGPNADEGGDMGYVRKGDMRDEIDSVIFQLAPGRVHGIVTTELGYHILKVEDRKGESIKSLAEVTDEITNILYRIKMREGLTEWLEGLRKKAYIEIKDE